MDAIENIVSSIDDAVSRFGVNIPDLEHHMIDLLDNVTKELEVKNGRILSNVNNLKRIYSLKKRLSKIVLNNSYLKEVKAFVKIFDTVSNLQTDYFAEFNNKFTPVKTAPILKDIAIDAAIESLTESGVDASVSKPIMEMLKTSVTSGGSYAELTRTLHDNLISSEGKPSILDRHLRTVTTDAINQFNGQSIKLFSDDLGLEWYRYVGGSKTTSRELCSHLVKKEWIHKSELDEVIRGQIDGHQCKVNPRTDLPLGMIAGTTTTNFIVNRGGYNCGHKLIPVPKEIVPGNIRAKFEQ
jgi:hypothetical protein